MDLQDVLEHGRIIERGAHQQLLAAGGRYATMWAARI
jgi:ABC-type transport system involved in Fe-S cluster assembly fused permease/ATPase subunit